MNEDKFTVLMYEVYDAYNESLEESGDVLDPMISISDLKSYIDRLNVAVDMRNRNIVTKANSGKEPLPEFPLIHFTVK